MLCLRPAARLSLGLLTAVSLLALSCSPHRETVPDGTQNVGLASATPPPASVSTEVAPDASAAPEGSAGPASSAAAAGEVIKTLFVGPALVDCEGEGPRKCLRVRESATGAWELFYQRIQGFEHKPGTVSEVRVKVTPSERGPRYELVEVLSERPAEL